MQKSFRLKDKSKGYLALIITSFFWGTTWVASKIAVQEISSIQLASIRQSIAGLCFVSYFLFYKKIPLPTLKQWRWLMVMSILMFVFANWLSTWGLKYISTGLGALIGSLYPLSVVLIEWIFFKSKKITILTFIGLFLGIAGVIFVFYSSMFAQINYALIFGLSLSVFAMLSWSLGTVFLVRNKTNINPYYATGWQMLLSSCILFIISFFTNQVKPIALISFNVWAAILYLVIFGSVISFVAFIYSTKKLPPAISSLYAYINPIVAIIVAAILLGEKISVSLIWGAIVTLIGIFLVNYSVKKDEEKVIVEPEI